MVRKQVNVVNSVSEKKKAIVRSVLEFYSLFCDAVVLKCLQCFGCSVLSFFTVWSLLVTGHLTEHYALLISIPPFLCHSSGTFGSNVLFWSPSMNVILLSVDFFPLKLRRVVSSVGGCYEIRKPGYRRFRLISKKLFLRKKYPLPRFHV